LTPFYNAFVFIVSYWRACTPGTIRSTL